MDDKLLDKVVAVVRVRGRMHVRSDINETLDRLNVPRVNNCTVIKLTPSYMGMLDKCNNYIAFGEISEETMKILIKKQGIEVGSGDQPIESMLGKINDHVPIRLHPPRRGYRSIKRGYKQGGALGYMGAEINGLIKRMV
ncbi:MAG: uL30 family ribosomal protein [Candidatus Marsarchaeota archaeon]|nr:uL30 family ribosomal protein [Candidatus Marsarchaeota archaeon]MCL5419057.1 uL30 family ribosomal protein [Candidatus Marsarchaeota archaeon]